MVARRPRRRSKRLPSEPVQVHVQDLAHDGRGVGRIEGETDAGKTVFVHGALPGEQVLAKLIGRTRQFDEAVVEEVLSPSPDRIEPACPWFEQCGGCALLHMDHSAQVAWKHKRLVDNLERIGQVSPAQWAEPLSAHPWGYRRRARLSVRDVPGKGRVLVGFREKQGRFVADIGHCDVLDPVFGQKLEALSDLVGQLSVRSAVPQIEIAVGDESAAMIIRHLEALTSDDVMALKKWSDAHHIAVYLQPKGPDTIHGLTESGTLSYTLPDFDIQLSFHPEQFIQVNAKINQQLIRRALEWLSLDEQDRVLDLFCGLGNFTLPLATRAKEVVGVEGDATLVEAAKANALANKLSNAFFHVADLSLAPEAHAFLRQSFDAVLIDPPRSGAESVLPVVAASQAKRIVYVSCNPATLARDAGILVKDYGYHLKTAGIADMFPHTAHVESIALFEGRP